MAMFKGKIGLQHAEIGKNLISSDVIVYKDTWFPPFTKFRIIDIKEIDRDRLMPTPVSYITHIEIYPLIPDNITHYDSILIVPWDVESSHFMILED